MAPVKNNVKTWLEENAKYFQPPICNKLMYEDGQLKTFLVGGPNSRKDFHMEEGEEFFYMLKGDMKLVVVEQGKCKDIVIKEGEVFLLPARIPHSPQRYADTIGLVIERERLLKEMDCLRYYVENSNEILYEKWFYCKSLEELGPLIKEYFASEAHLTGRPTAGTILEDKPIKQDFRRTLDEPFSLKAWLEENKREIDADGKKELFKGNYVSRVHILGEGEHVPDNDLPEIFLWQIEGRSVVLSEGKSYDMFKDDYILIPKGERYVIRSGKESRILSLVMNPLEG